MQLRTAAFFAAAVTAAAFTAPANGQSQKPPAAPAPASVPRVNVNVATAAQIALLPRIGSTVAARVVDYRKAHGPFQRVEDLMEVKGIGEKLFLTIKPYVAVSGPTTLAEKLKAPKRGASPASKSASSSKPAPKPAAKPAAPAGPGR